MRARAQQEDEIRGHPDDVTLLSELGLIDAGLGRKEEALSEGRRAMELASSVKDADTEPYVKICFAIICAWTGERELALEQLEALTKTPGYLHLRQLALESAVGSFARRSALRKNRRLVRTKVSGTLQLRSKRSRKGTTHAEEADADCPINVRCRGRVV